MLKRASTPLQAVFVIMCPMPDMLVQLLKLPPLDPDLRRLRDLNINIRRANAYEATHVYDFVRKNFSQGWVDEVTVCFSNKPITVYIATHEGKIIGFGGYECTRRGFFGPTGVLESEREKGVGR